MTTQEDQIIAEYGSLMNEAKIRLSSAIILIYEPPAGHPPAIIKECIFLQFRMLCELIALGCLLAHGGMREAQTQRFRKAHAADRIIIDLEKLHPHVFPNAFAPKVDPAGCLKAIADAPGGYLTKDELLRLYGLCGDTLHRGNIQRFRSKKVTPDTDKAGTKLWASKIRNLLENHFMVLSGMDKIIVCAMRLAEEGRPVVTMSLEAKP